MRNKKGKVKFVFIGLIFILLAFPLMLMIKFCFAGPTRQQAEQVIRSEFTAILAASSDRGNQIAQAISENFSVSIESIDRISSILESEEYRVKCTVANYDIGAVYAQVDTEQQMTLNDFMQWFVQRLLAQQMLYYQEEFILYKVGNQYRLQFTSEQFDHCSGGLMSYFNGGQEDAA